MGAFLSSIFSRKPAETPVKGIGDRIINTVKCHYRGFFGVLIPVIFFCVKGSKNPKDMIHHMWFLMFWCFLLQPVTTPVTAMIPIFFPPMTGAAKSENVCSYFFNDGVGLMIVAGALILLLNNTGADRRFALWVLCSGNSSQFTANRMVFKAATASFFLSMFSSRQITCAVLNQFMSPALMSMNASKGKGDLNYEHVRHIVMNVVHTSCSIGSTAIIHSSYTILLFRAVFNRCSDTSKLTPDIFNYLQYSCFAFPVAFVQFILNILYHMYLLRSAGKSPMTAARMSAMQAAMMKAKSGLPKNMSVHEKQSVFFAFVSLLAFFFRWGPWISHGWAAMNIQYSLDDDKHPLPFVKDTTVAAVFVIALHILPKGLSFMKYFTASKKSQLPAFKPESAILWWKFVNNNLNYSYIYLFGGAIALCACIRKTSSGHMVGEMFAPIFASGTFEVNLLLVCVVASVLANCMPGLAAVTVLMPLIIHINDSKGDVETETEAPAGFLRRLMQLDTGAGGPTAVSASGPWVNKVYLGALAVGLCGTYGFMPHFVYTPSYVAKTAGKVPPKRIAINSIGSVIICTVVAWLGIAFYAPMIWGGDRTTQVASFIAPKTTAGTEATEAAMF